MPVFTTSRVVFPLQSDCSYLQAIGLIYRLDFAALIIMACCEPGWKQFGKFSKTVDVAPMYPYWIIFKAFDEFGNMFPNSSKALKMIQYGYIGATSTVFENFPNCFHPGSQQAIIIKAANMYWMDMTCCVSLYRITFFYISISSKIYIRRIFNCIY